MPRLQWSLIHQENGTPLCAEMENSPKWRGHLICGKISLQYVMTGEPRIARAEIAKHVKKITLTPEGRMSIASGTWDLLGDVAVTMVPGAQIAPCSPMILFYIRMVA
jgi:hypothetical protein